MIWLWVVVALGALLAVASLSRGPRDRSAVAVIRTQFPRIARMRLIAACPLLDGVLETRDLRLTFDWILAQMYRRTGTSNFAELMQWSAEKGEAEAARLTAEVTREAIDRLPRPVLAVLDECRGRTFAAVLLDESLTEAGRRSAPELARST